VRARSFERVRGLHRQPPDGHAPSPRGGAAANLGRALEKAYGRPVPPDEADEIARNVAAFFELLDEWDAAVRQGEPSDGPSR
jgi:hypothetical protein